MTTQTLRAGHLPLIRPAWTPATIALMVGGFIVFWPLGLAMLAYIIWGDRFHAWRDGKASFGEAMNSEFKGRWSRDCGPRSARGFTASARTGNVAFDAWRDKELERLAEERRKLEALRDEFDAYARELRRAKDQEEFDRFMRDREASRAAGEAATSANDVDQPMPKPVKPSSKKPGPNINED
ncbi:MAG: DUF2852 domain-containing protein [Rhizobiaceae bacterium]|jgi:hypothetical protein|nr:DUF2852 domain-containing protein [Rhizobiaceae bacterium]